ncbi:MAG: Rieske (2Fe-2S) protein [Haliea sp.]|nr:Rieske (2Fe-2S) protein [Haliea sp.]
MTNKDHTVDWSARSKRIDYARVSSLQLLGNYTRSLPISIERMLENALDWEHLPHVHASSFGAIECIDSGRWGWRARTAQPTVPGAEGVSAHNQSLELLVDLQAHYWATAILVGPAAGIEIHTQATPVAEHEIAIDVRFYSVQPVDAVHVPLYLDALRMQYALLYDEDLLLMQGRQRALDNHSRWSGNEAASIGASEPLEIFVGEAGSIAATGRMSVDTPTGRYCVRRHAGTWLVHSAMCPHMLGPLDEATVDAQGVITCPWHGYRFDLFSGKSLQGRCPSLDTTALVFERDGNLFLRIHPHSHSRRDSSGC